MQNVESPHHGKHSVPRHLREPDPARPPRRRRPVFIPVASVAVACALVGGALAVHSMNSTHGVLSASSSTSGPLFGVSVSGSGGLALSTADFGTLPIIRTSYGRLPAASIWTTGPAGSNNSAAVVTFRARPGVVLSGDDDAALSNFFAGAPTGHPIY